MIMRKCFFLVLILWIGKSCIVTAQVYSPQYKSLQNQLASGWNTWSYGSSLAHVLLPEGLVLKVNFRQSFIGATGDANFFINEVNIDKTGFVRPIAHTFDGSYTELDIENWYGNHLKIQSAAVGSDVFVLVTPVKKSKDKKFYVEMETGVMWNRPGQIHRKGDSIVAEFNNSRYVIKTTKPTVETYHNYTSPYLIVEGDTTIGFYTGKNKSLSDIKIVIEGAQKRYNEYALKFGNLSEAFKGIQTVLGWNTLYDPYLNRVITPVSRGWNEAWQGFVLFEWDTFFASFLFGLDNKELAYSNAIAVTKGINNLGHLGHWQMPGSKAALGMSQPPVGSMICWKIYEKYQEKWFLEEVYAELLTWNRWWVANRLNKGYLAWGGWKGAEPQIAAWESGMDNAPMYEDVKMLEFEKSSLQNLADVGLNSLYANDCVYLSKMAEVLGKKADLKELRERAQKFKQATQKLWNAEAGIFLNKYTDTDTPSERLSPTLFYPTLIGAATKEQVSTMLQKHFYNEKEFYGEFMMPSCSKIDKSYNNAYWRGSVWPPLNFLVYMGLKEYDKKASKELADKSYAMFIKAWENNNYVYENINSAKGPSNKIDQVDCDTFYHWGGLMAIMKFMEEGKY